MFLYLNTSVFQILKNIFLLIIIISISACSKQGAGVLFGKRSPHQIYEQSLKDAGLHQTSLGKLWMEVAEKSLQNPIDILIPYKETGYFTSEKIKATAFRFKAKRGEKLTVQLVISPSTFKIYEDLFEVSKEKTLKILASADTSNSVLNYEIEEEGTYLIRLQPELLRNGEYTLTILSGPSLAYPIKAKGSNHIQSFWGDGRDNGARKHEGIDLFAPFRTPVLAASDGIITRVQETEIGGKVVWLKSAGKNYNLYYAHLDSQIVTDGQTVKVGDTLGLMGKTGNAKYTSPHLHFGIYTFGGAVDPFPYVNPTTIKPRNIIVSLKNLNTIMRASNVSKLFRDLKTTDIHSTLGKNTPVVIEAATGEFYRVVTPDGLSGYVTQSNLGGSSKALKKFTIEKVGYLYENPDTTSAKKMKTQKGRRLNVIGHFKNYSLVDDEGVVGWLLNEPI